MSGVATTCYARRVLAGAAVAVFLGGAHAVAQTSPVSPATTAGAPIAATPSAISAPSMTSDPQAASAPSTVSAPQAGSVAPTASAPPAAATLPEADIRDIRGPKAIFSVWTLALLLAGGALAAVGAYAAWRWNRLRKLRAVKLPFEIALQRIENASALMHANSGRAFSIEVSDAVREYIERRFQVMAAHRTTHEFLHDLLGSADAVLAEHRSLLEGFLNLCDLAKFAGWHLSMEDMQTMQRSARAFVLATAQSGETTKSGVAAQPSTGMKIYDSLPST